MWDAGAKIIVLKKWFQPFFWSDHFPAYCMLSGKSRFSLLKKRLIFFLDRNSHVMNLNNEGEKHVSISAANAATVLSPVGTPTPSTVTPPVAAETAGAVIETNVNEVTIPSSSNQTQNDNEPSSQIIQEDSNKVNYWP